MNLSKKEMISYVGGSVAFTATLLNAINNLIKNIYKIGENLGSLLKKC